MTRLDATSEPSMEDILASIRKIIAEDPPGSRPALTPSAPSALQPQNAAPQQSLRTPERDPFSAFARRNDDAASTSAQSYAASPEPYLKTSPQKSATSEFGNEPFFAPRSPGSTSSFDQATSAPSRIEPSFGPRSSAPAPAVDVADEPVAPAADVSVDAQLSDLLGETASVVIQPAPVAAAPVAASPAPRFGDRMAGRVAPTPSTAARAETAMPLASSATSAPQDERPGFTVSRDGFVAAPDDMASTAEPDPFDFDLGPSPFLAKPDAPASTPAAPATPVAPAPAPTGNSLTARMSASSLERISAPSVAATVADASKIQVESEPEKAPETRAASPEPFASVAPVAGMAAPSVAATLAPTSFEPTPAAEPVGRFIPANAAVEAPKSVDRDVLEVGAPKLSAADSAPIEVVRVAAEVDTQEPAPSMSPSSSTAIAVHHAEGHMRTMEETVAELLRPMLKSWLAENMPRIVERALRRELSEQMMLGKKDAAE